MSLTQEQQRELDQLNELFRKFDHQLAILIFEALHFAC